ncbi:MAG: hypothetical protein ABSC19_05900 [Syntrophorhabdales bacterium]|jgi:hypothetical protein
MGNIVANLATALMTDQKAQTTERASTAESSAGIFSGLLCRLMSETSQGGAGSGGAEATSGDSSGLLSALAGDDMETFVQTLQATMLAQKSHTGAEVGITAATTGAVAAASPGASGADPGAAASTTAGGTDDNGAVLDSGAAPEQQLEDLMMGLLALLMMKGAGAQDDPKTEAGAGSAGQKEAATGNNATVVTLPAGNNSGAPREGSALTSDPAGTESTGRKAALAPRDNLPSISVPIGMAAPAKYEATEISGDEVAPGSKVLSTSPGQPLAGPAGTEAGSQKATGGEVSPERLSDVTASAAGASLALSDIPPDKASSIDPSVISMAAREGYGAALGEGSPEGLTATDAAPAGTALANASGVSSKDATTDKASKPEDQTVLGTLALLVFTGLQTIEAARNNGPSGKSDGTGQPLAATGQAYRVPVSQAAGTPGRSLSKGAGPTDRVAAVSSNSGVNGLSERFFKQGTGSTDATGATKTDVKVELFSTPAEKGVADTNTNNVTLRVVGSAGITAQGIPPAEVTGNNLGAAGGISTGNQAGEGRIDDNATIVGEITPLIESRDDDPSGGAKGNNKEGPGYREAYSFTSDGNVSGVDAAGQQQKQESVHPSAAAAVEKFEQVMEQIGGKNGSHDLTVRLTMGNEESLVLGMKDHGQNVTVEVRASNQGMINLLQSQRDVIVRHLEGKDIHTNIMIDPNTSGTPGRRDRREARQRPFTSAPQDDGTFAASLEIFA